MTAEEEARLYHEPGRWGWAALLLDGQQRPFPLADLPGVLDSLPAESDAFLSQSEFCRPNRRLVNLARLGLLFSDCDLPKTPYADWNPDRAARALLFHCEENHLPAPSLINFSGRGLHCKWLLDCPIPGVALPRWNLVQKELCDRLKPFGADRAARDGSRCLRAVGTLNSRSGLLCETVWQDERGGAINRWPFEEICRELLPFTREQLREAKAQRQARKQAKAATAGRSANLWTARQLWWNRLFDLRRLIERRGWQGGVPEGFRNNWLFIAACAVAYGVEPRYLEAEIGELAREFTPSLTPSEVRSATVSAIAKARAGTPYRFSSARLIELLEITPAEQKGLRTLIDPDERQRRRKAYDAGRQWGQQSREEYEATAQARRMEAKRLRAEGLSYRQIAEHMGLTVKQVDNLLNR